VIKGVGREANVGEHFQHLLSTHPNGGARQFRAKHLHSDEVAQVAPVGRAESCNTSLRRNPAKQRGASIIQILEQGFEIN
jgi:hypothetical protein